VSALDASDLVDRARYELVRDGYRARVLEHKRSRRVELGELVSLTFEDRETVRYQILEMARVERIDDPRRLAHEIEVYGELLPNERELAATLFIQIPDMARIRSELDRLLGIDECVSLAIGRGANAVRVRARFDERQLEADRISAVHYLRFPFDEQGRERFLASDEDEPVALAVDHPNYAREVALAGAVRESLRRDLRGEQPQLLDPRAVPAAPPLERAIFDDGVVRAVELAGRAGERRVRIEPAANAPALPDCAPELVRALFAKAHELASELAARGATVRISAEVAPAGTAGARACVELVARSGGDPTR